MQVRSYAKINIGLRILGKRSDGYHELETLFQQIDFYDDLFFEPLPSQEILLTCNAPACPTDDRNLIVRAANLLKPFATSEHAGCRIHLIKRIPIGGGLGGGSSNAAVTLKALNELWNCRKSQTELAALAATIGADAAFFIFGGLALGEGKGEQITPLPHRPDYFGVLLIPDFSIATADVYRKLNLSLTLSMKSSIFKSFASNLPPFAEWKFLFTNDLETVVLRDFTILRQWVESFYQLGAFYAALSGSGSSVFGLFSTKEAAETAFKKLRDTGARTVVFRPMFT
ncbi:MAG: 4-(cytidine 5'-diphospho)-2-C-methyl-D-erythritol kinase [candidate division KSB1 bacterium]|nr:4-(cytidine 5'-diphospho)-2-C-methyl-D-erythritol kinase [candidate division KSB1 bacterium]